MIGSRAGWHGNGKAASSDKLLRRLARQLTGLHDVWSPRWLAW